MGPYNLISQLLSTCRIALSDVQGVGAWNQ